MKYSIISIFILISFGVFSQPSEIVYGKGFKGAIFNKDYDMLYRTNPPRDLRFTPTKQEIAQLESKLRTEIKTLNRDKPNQGHNYGPIVHKNLKKYLRQYIGFITPEGERVVYVNFLWNKLNIIEKIKGYSLYTDGYESDWISVSDGGSKYWVIKYNLDKHVFFDFYVNGVA